MTIDYRTPLIEVPRPTDALELLRAYKALALYSIGLSGSGARRAPFADLLSPRTLPGADAKRISGNKGTRAAVYHLLQFVFSLSLPPSRRGISTCGMTAEGQDGCMGVDAETLYRTYVWGTSVSRAIEYYKAHGAWTWADKAHPDDRPPLCAYVVIGLTPPKGQVNDYGGIEHAFRILARDPHDIFRSADGGSVEAGTGLQCVKHVTRRWVVIRGHAWLVDPLTGKGRRVLGWGDPTLLGFRPDVLMRVPQGWEQVEIDDADVPSDPLRLDSAKGVQQALNLLGAQPQLDVDGDFGGKSRAALKTFQARAGLPATGQVDTATRDALAMALA